MDLRGIHAFHADRSNLRANFRSACNRPEIIFYGLFNAAVSSSVYGIE
jgi:hypothetical protein